MGTQHETPAPKLRSKLDERTLSQSNSQGQNQRVNPISGEQRRPTINNMKIDDARRSTVGQVLKVVANARMSLDDRVMMLKFFAKLSRHTV